MKKIFTSICLASLALFTYGQSMRLFVGTADITNTTIEVGVTDGLASVNEIDIHNTSSNIITFKVTRMIVNAPLGAGCAVYFCTGTSCFPPNSAASYTQPGTGITIGADSNLIGTRGITAHFDEGSPLTETYIHYKVYNLSDYSDTACFTMHYKLATGIPEIEKIAGTITNAFPNPSNGFISFKYSLNENAQKGVILFYDMLGKKVKEVVLTDKQGLSKIDAAELNEGIYFYTFLVDGKAVSTKKLVISSN